MTVNVQIGDPVIQPAVGDGVGGKDTNAPPSYWDFITAPFRTVNAAADAFNDSANATLQDKFTAVTAPITEKIKAAAGYLEAEHEKTNDTLKYVAIIAGVVGVVYVVGLLAPAISAGSTWVPRKA